MCQCNQFPNGFAGPSSQVASLSVFVFTTNFCQPSFTWSNLGAELVVRIFVSTHSLSVFCVGTHMQAIWRKSGQLAVIPSSWSSLSSIQTGGMATRENLKRTIPSPPLNSDWMGVLWSQSHGNHACLSPCLPLCALIFLFFWIHCKEELFLVLAFFFQAMHVKPTLTSLLQLESGYY